MLGILPDPRAEGHACELTVTFTALGNAGISTFPLSVVGSGHRNSSELVGSPLLSRLSNGLAPVD